MTKQSDIDLEFCMKYNSSVHSVLKISKNIFTVYVGLIASGYELSQDKGMAESISAVKWDASAVRYFGKARTTYCDVNPYWPRGSMVAVASLDLEDKPGFEYADFMRMKKKLDSFGNVDPDENGKETELWLQQLPVYYSLIRENKEFQRLWDEYVRRVEAVSSEFIDAVNRAKEKVSSRFKINIAQLPDLRVIPNILGLSFNADFAEIDNIIYVICAQPAISSFVHEYLHNILERGVRYNQEKVREKAYLINPVFESMLYYKYAWEKDSSSWCRIFEENLVRAATIWVNDPDDNTASQSLKSQESMGFLYVPVLLEEFKISEFDYNKSEGFIIKCLQACEAKYNELIGRN